MDTRVKKHQIYMNKMIVFICLISFIMQALGCMNTSKDEGNNNNIGVQVVKNVGNSLLKTYPDTTINNKLTLVDYYSTKKFYPDYSKLSYNDITEFSHPFVLFVNEDITQYLIAYTYEGSTINAFDYFEIGYYNDEKKLDIINYYKTDELYFRTESNLGLGNSWEEIIDKKGTNYKKEQIGNDLLVKYEINDTNDPFLQRYHMPSYFEKFYLRENKVYKLIFGFEYP